MRPLFLCVKESLGGVDYYICFTCHTTNSTVVHYNSMILYDIIIDRSIIVPGGVVLGMYINRELKG